MMEEHMKKLSREDRKKYDLHYVECCKEHGAVSYKSLHKLANAQHKEIKFLHKELKQCVKQIKKNNEYHLKRLHNLYWKAKKGRHNAD
jgi:hypothetical protein|tara:strand:- start:318 stop:581 length:264 start_codon:yes stop_codon:yes gene_type:complete